MVSQFVDIYKKSVCLNLRKATWRVQLLFNLKSILWQKALNACVVSADVENSWSWNWNALIGRLLHYANSFHQNCFIKYLNYPVVYTFFLSGIWLWLIVRYTTGGLKANGTLELGDPPKRMNERMLDFSIGYTQRCATLRTNLVGYFKLSYNVLCLAFLMSDHGMVLPERH